MTAMNRLNSRNCFMLFYYQIVTCLLVTCAAAAVLTWVCITACRRPMFSIKNSFSGVIVNEHLKLKMINDDTVWGGVSSGEGTKLGAQNRQKLPILDPTILSLKHPDF